MQTVTAIPDTGFWAPATLLERPIRVLLIGAGGTGGEMLDRLIRLHFGLVRTGHPGGLDVTLWDGDTVSDANIGRQRFAPCDIGYNKADLLIHRANLAFGLH
jgi:PRTRC genetic system ThiF family protein